VTTNSATQIKQHIQLCFSSLITRLNGHSSPLKVMSFRVSERRYHIHWP